MPQHVFDDEATTGIFLRRPEGTRSMTPAGSTRRAPQAAAVNADTLWDANDVARYLKVSRSWVYHRAEAGLMPHLRVGGLLRFDPDVVRVFARRK